MSLVLALQYWPGDYGEAMELARLITDIEPAKRDDVTFLFAARRDAKIDENEVAYVATKFPVKTFQGKSDASGWPLGPNALFRETYQHCIEMIRSGRMQGDGILFMEPDCVPLAPNWIDQLKAEWEECKAKGKQILGCWLMEGDCGVEHINGNCIIHKDFWKANREILTHKGGGWDADCRGVMLPMGMPSKLIWSDYGLGKPGYNDWKGCDHLFATKRFRATNNPLFGQDLTCAWHHGSKVSAGYDCVRDRFKLPPRR